MQEKIKILFLAPHLSTGGMPSFLLKRIQALIDNEKFELFVVEYADIGGWAYVVQKNEIKRIIKPENFITLYEDKSILMDIIRDNKIDIVHADEILEGFDHSNKIPDVMLNELYDNNRTWKMVETCHNVWFNPETSKKFNPDGYAFCTPWHKSKTFNMMPSYGEVLQFPIENKVPTDEEKLEAKLSLGMDPNKKHVINVGLWTSGKNQKEGVEVAKSLEESNPEIQFHFIGNQAPNFEDYWGPVMENLPSNVTVWDERSDVDTFMKAADLFMFNSTWECNPLVLREATSYGLKILTRNLEQYMDMFTPYITEINGDIASTKYKLIALLYSDKKYVVEDQLESFKENYSEFYKRVNRMPIMEQSRFISKPIINQNFVNNPFLEVLGTSDSSFRIEFYDELGKCHYSNTLSINHWIRLNREYFTEWNTKVWENGYLIHDYTLDLKGKRVFITLESSSLGDTLAWVPFIREFKDKHDCELIVSTFMNNLFRESYPDIEFVEPGSVVNNIYAMYKIGWFYKDDEFDLAKNPNDFRKEPLQKTASDILGLEYKETRALLNIPKVEKKKKVGIGMHSTCQAKYWNNPNGWQEVVDYLNYLGYEVVLYSKENDGYMGNFHPIGINKFEAGSIEKLIDDMATCEFFVGLGSGLSWLSWTIGLPTVLISGFSEEQSETVLNTYRVINKSVCNGCFNRHRLDSGDWNWCPDHKGTERQFECTKQITSSMVIEKINQIING
jgi:autotransporter strand-loop-strand O-heptosyltransferase